MAQSHKSLLQQLAICPLCSEKYNGAKVSIINNDGDSFHVACPKCKKNIVIFTKRSQSGVFNVGMLTDVTSSEILLLQGDKISSNEVLDLYSIVHNQSIEMKDIIIIDGN